jgi:hypothetical protein
MICQVQSVKTKTAALPEVDKGLLQARQIQARLKPRITATHTRPVWSPITPGPFMVPVSRWVE